MPKGPRYLLGRVIKLGQVTHDGIVSTILNPPTIQLGRYSYTFTDAVHVNGVLDFDFVYGRLAKYAPLGEINVVDPDQHTTSSENAANLLYAYSTFVYIPSYSGIAFQDVPGRLEGVQFPKAFAKLIESHYDGFFAQLMIENTIKFGYQIVSAYVYFYCDSSITYYSHAPHVLILYIYVDFYHFVHFY